MDVLEYNIDVVLGATLTKSLNSNDNLNDIRENVVAYCNSVTNKPVNSNGIVLSLVAQANSKSLQIYVTAESSTYIRVFWNGTWADWKEIIKTDL